MTATNKDLRRRGYPQADIELAQRQREAEKRAGSSPRSVSEVLAGQPARPRPNAVPTDLTQRQLRGRGRYGQAALLADQQAVNECDLGRATKARVASGILKELANKPVQLEFSFLMGGNVSTGYQYLDAILGRLKATDVPASQRRTALATLGIIIRWLGWQSHECQRNAAELADLLDMDEGDMARTLNLLESVGAISRVKRGRTKTIVVTPEGAYRGDINRHAEAVDRYRAEVVPLKRPRRQNDDTPPAAA